MLNLMFITNREEVALIAEEAGVDRIFVDMEFIGKEERQQGLNSVKNCHTFEDIIKLKKCLTKSKLLVRINKIHDKTNEFISSEEEIDKAIKCGADILMLPYFKTKEEVERFIKAVNGRCKTMLLLETMDAVNSLNEILKVKGIDEIHIGLNDLSICLHERFMFQPLADGIVDKIVDKIKLFGIPFGFGGIARLGLGEVSAENIISEHYRLGSQFAILSRSFCNVEKENNIENIKNIFINEVKNIRNYEKIVENFTAFQFEERRKAVKEKINLISKKLEENN